MRRAFSLIELVIVIAIIVTLGAIAAPRYLLAAMRYRSDAAVRRVAADLDYARVAARSTGTTVTVTFDTVGHAYEISGVAGLRVSTDTYRVELDEPPYDARLDTLALDVPVILDDPATIVFDAYGVPDGGGSVTITVGSETRSVTVDDNGVVTTGP